MVTHRFKSKVTKGATLLGVLVVQLTNQGCAHLDDRPQMVQYYNPQYNATFAENVRVDWLADSRISSMSPDGQHSYRGYNENIPGGDGRKIATTHEDVASVVLPRLPKVPPIERVFGWTLLKQSIVLSPDGKHVAYRLSENDGNMQCVGQDGRVGRRCYEVYGPTFSPDSKRLAYFGETHHGWRLIVDGEPGPCHVPVSAPIFTPDSKRIAYWSRRGKRLFLVLEGKAQRTYDAVQLQSLTFSSDGEHYAYIARRGRQWLLVVDGHEQPIEGPYVDRLMFSADGITIFFR